MVRSIRFAMVMVGVSALFLAAVPSGDSGHGSIYRCTGSTGFGETEWAECDLDHPDCSVGFCQSWPEVHIRVWADDSVEASLTQMVTGSIGSEEVCRGFDSCEGSFQRVGAYGQHEYCWGSGPWDGSLVLVRSPTANAPWAVHMECWVDGY